MTQIIRPPEPARPGRHAIAEFLAAVHLGARRDHKQLALWPLIRAGRASRFPYICLADALVSGAARVDEVGGGTVPHVALQNLGDVSVLVLFGEEIVGAKQNRVANASFLVAPKSQVVLDVSCVEQGRWSAHLGSSFSTGEHVISSALRREMAERVGRSRAAGRGFDADQGAVWHGVSRRVGTMRDPSRTDAYRDYARSHERELAEMARHFEPIEDQVGFVALRGDRVEGAEAVGDPAVYARVHERLLRAYTIDAIDHAQAEFAPSDGAAFRAPEDFLRALAGSAYEAGPSLGQGEDLRLRGSKLDGCALDCGGIVHLMAFPSSAHVDRSSDAGPPPCRTECGGPRIRSRLRWWNRG